jgi:predicted GNAT family acetyltransferase
MATTVEDNRARSRFEVLVDGELGGFATYRQREDVLFVTHSEVDPRFRGRGVGAELARQTLDLLRERGARVVPACPFFAEYVQKHPEYNDILEN